ncbi:peptigoglycan-binding protein LysM [Streptomyces phaeoluteigriseus]|uniref:Peptigoglycan-binding protein LysM n=1 Tax=Streptomyces phaeoluteigriseus TaxID=114686 RepID=A0A1V6MTK7_9ACTN|nr:transglycosylase family protein [Streptomyces phaeoluteigriseus]OQD55685.1 peptigoglycan-binding protein LysM [Streptomyces phaeoluteigriseus]
MLSGNGRHRRPRQAPALLVAAGVTGSAIAIPLLGATGASAADGTVWDTVAECESGGSWSADTGNGEYGGLALSQEDWEAYGGLDFAERPDLASRNQQISVAQKVLADQGIGAWGTCGLTSGLTKANGAGSVDTGVADNSSDSSVSSGLSDLSKGSSGSSGSSDSTDPSQSSGSTGDSADPSAESSPDGTDSTSSSPSSSSSGTPDSSSKSDTPADVDASVAGSGDSSPTATPEANGSDKSVQEVGSWSLVDTGSLASGRHRGTTAEEVAPAPDGITTASSGRHAAATYVVREGDSLASIADSLALDGGWRALYAENKAAIGVDPNNITAGQTLDTAVE